MGVGLGGTSTQIPGALGGAGGFDDTAGSSDAITMQVIPQRSHRPRLSRAAQRRRASLAGLEHLDPESALFAPYSSTSASRRASSQGLRASTGPTSSSSGKRSSKRDTDDAGITVSASSPSDGSMRLQGVSARNIFGEPDADADASAGRVDTKESTTSIDSSKKELVRRHRTSSAARLKVRPSRGGMS